ncbi:MAG: MotA/TolQ/ExbB proton channel family protein [Sneathiella sp.]
MTEILEILEKTGLVGYSLAGLSVLMLTITVSKILQLLFSGSFSSSGTAKATQAIEQGDYETALQIFHNFRSPGKSLLITALHGALRAKTPEELTLIDREVERQGAALYSDMNSGLKLLGLIAMVSPLLGLLGTVLGMINAFQAMESAGAAVDASLLSGGIWEALLTTAMGLVVAIPATLFHSYLQSRVNKTIEGLTDRVNWIFFMVKNKGLLQPTPSSSPAPSTSFSIPQTT